MEDGGPSQTARRVAAHRLDFTRVPADYGDPAADQALATDVAGGLLAPEGRMHDYLAARTSFFDRTVTAALGRGVRQIVVGAAGYDGRAFRYAKPGVRWFEVDHPATQRDKLRRLERLGIDASRVRFVEADFTRDPVADRLRASGLDPGAPTLFLLEGIAVYLEPAVLENVLGQFRQVAGPGSRLAISVSLSRPRDDGARARFQATVAALGEPARSTFEAGEAEALLARTGWRIAAAPDDDRQAATRRERLRTAGLILADAGPVSAGPASASPAAPARTSRRAPRRPAASSPAPRPQLPPGLLPLSALLSQALVAFTIEFDNEAEHRLPQRTTSHGSRSYGEGDATWLVSLAMWENCMRHVTGEPITVGDLEARARTGTNLDGMRRWGYVTIDGTAKKIHHGRPGPDAVLAATAAGLRARETWRPLAGQIEQRWRERCGADQVDGLRAPLVSMVGQLDPGLPDCLPILHAALLSQGPDPALPPRPASTAPADLPLSALLSRVLLSFAVEYEREAGLSLAVGANVLRVLGAERTRPRDLPALTGTSQAAVRWALGLLTRSELAAEEPDPAASRGQVVRLTARGLDAQRVYHELAGAIERRWRERFTRDATDALRACLEPLAAGNPPPLIAGLQPYPDNWRASVRPPVTLPYFPMVLHRGGYPDGS
ncbi:MAG TPA: SAM-dependent methyltransferase [Streptosporangiaceae bacterium]